MIHKWEKKKQNWHTHTIMRALSSAWAAVGCRTPNCFSPSCHFLIPPSLSPSLFLPLPLFNERSASLNATSGAQIKSFTVHREKRRLATMQPLGNQCVFSKLRHHRLLWHLIRRRRGAVQMCETCFLAAPKG